MEHTEPSNEELGITPRPWIGVLLCSITLLIEITLIVWWII